MARITSYPSDTTPEGSDLLLGNGPSSGETKVFTLSNVAVWMNESGNVNIVGQSNFKYSYDLQSAGNINVPGETGEVSFSNVSELLVNNKASNGRDIVEYFTANALGAVTIGRLDAPDEYGVFTLASFEPHPTFTNYHVANLSFQKGNGTFKEDKSYGIATTSAQGGGGGPQQTYGIISEDGSLFDIAVTNDGDLIVIPEGSTEPVITSPPVIVGTEKVWYTLGAIAGGVTGSPTPLRTWQWQRSPNGLTWTDIEGATAATYTIVAEDAGQRLRVQQIETNVLDSATSSSDPTGVIAASVFSDTIYQDIAPVTWGQLTVQTWD
jgi:hypothetical protein